MAPRDDDEIEQRSRRRKFGRKASGSSGKWLLLAVGGVLLTGAVGGGIALAVVLLKDRDPAVRAPDPAGDDGPKKGMPPWTEMQEAVAEADRLDPDWRLKDLQAKRKTYPKEENAALCVLAAATSIPRGWPVEQLGPALERFPSNVQLRPDLVQLLRGQLQQVERARTEGRKLIKMPAGRYTVQWADDMHNSVMDHLPEVRKVGTMLTYDAVLRAEENELEGALFSCRCAMNAARSIGDEPALMSQVLRLALQLQVVRTIERVLSQGEPPDVALGAMGRLLEDEASQPILLYAARGERLMGQGMVESLKRGVAVEKVPRGATPQTAEQAQAWVLRQANELVEIAKLPRWDERKGRIDQLQRAWERGPQVARGLFPNNIGDIFNSFTREQAKLRCAFVAVAVERYRRTNQKWPADLKAVVDAGLLREVPLDPWDGKPLRYGPTGGGVMIYSVGLDSIDNGANVLDDDRPNQRETDTGLRLWDVKLRRQKS